MVLLSYDSLFSILTIFFRADYYPNLGVVFGDWDFGWVLVGFAVGTPEKNQFR